MLQLAIRQDVWSTELQQILNVQEAAGQQWEWQIRCKASFQGASIHDSCFSHEAIADGGPAKFDMSCPI